MTELLLPKWLMAPKFEPLKFYCISLEGFSPVARVRTLQFQILCQTDNVFFLVYLDI